jgi:hypothetical protein
MAGRDAKTMTLTATRIVAGVWEGVLAGATADPALEVLHDGKALDAVQVLALPGAAGRLSVRVPIPLALLNDGVQTFLIRSGAEVLARFTVIMGVPVEDDLRAEIDLLRAELDMLKRAFRRHCVDTGAV